MLPALTVHVRAHADTTVVALVGELDLDTRDQVTNVTDALPPLSGQVLVLDLSRMTFMDSTGINLFLILRARAHNEGGRLELTDVPRQALQVMDLTGTRELFAIRPSSFASRAVDRSDR
ncbi:STAS domain-containing protein [Streptomyces sp. NPDC020422]|uniref:STAS domain-containing protein n=1 Tax=Streptomyces sp. NPDC020422 TaxID=3365074 RepID=UPI0037B324E7